MKFQTQNSGGFSLVETLVASGVAAIVLTSIVIGGVSLQKMYIGSETSLKASADQARILDYVSQDLRQALTVTVANSGQTLALTVPDYVDPATNQPRMPSVRPDVAKFGMPKGVVNYGNATAPIAVSYFPASALVSPATQYVFQADGPLMIRQEGTRQMVISRDCTSLQVRFSDAIGTVGASVSFAPRFNFQNKTSDREGNTLYTTATLRNVRRN